MRQVDRSSFPKPEIYGSPEIQKNLKKLRAFYEQKQKKGLTQARSPLAKVLPHEGNFLFSALRLFQEKCAYCERGVRDTAKSAGPYLMPKLDLFRPHSEAISLDGGTDPEHYWWLAFEWRNHYLACADCLRYKRSNFPVLGNRIAYSPRRRVFKTDKGLLLDPCRDKPWLWLEFTYDGKVRSASPPLAATRRAWGDYDRGDLTIQILKLNRTPVVESRRRAAAMLDKKWLAFAASPAAAGAKKLEPLVTAEAPHAGMCRQLLAGHLLDLGRENPGSRSATKRLREQLAPEIDTLRRRRRAEARKSVAPAGRQRTAEQAVRKARSGELEEAEVEPAAGADGGDGGDGAISATLGTVRIQSLELRNYKAIHKLALSFNESGDLRVVEVTADGRVERYETRAGWEMLLGENGTGKSTVLEALASLLLGPRLLDEEVQEALDVAPRKVLRRGSRRGSVRVTFVGDDTVWELRITKTRYSFPNGAPVVGNFVRAYGATRLLPGRAQRSADPTDGEQVDVGNLFNPFVPLIDADAWLMGLDMDQFTYAARAITDLLDRAEDHFDGDGNLVPRSEELITRSDGHVLVDGDRLEHLSDGYRTVLAMCCDIMAAVPFVVDLHTTAGVVLVDEIGAHLHPSWKMRIVPALRRTFPAIQFVATTHEPLCLRGLLDGETVLMRRQAPGVGDGERRISARDDLPSPSELRVDQLLTSSLFGMDTTIDPDLDRKFSQYYYLLGRRDRTKEQDALCRHLRDELAGQGSLGYTRRDQKIYELIDELIAAERLLDPERRKGDRAKLKSLNERTRRRVLALWRYADLSQEVRS